MSMTMAARAHSGATLSAPVRRAQPARRKASWLGRVARIAGKRPGRAFVLMAFGVVSIAIVANALMFQKARHPAPMLSASTPASQSRTTTERRAEPVAAPAAEAPAVQPVRPPARPSDLSQTQAAREAQPRPPAPVQAAPRAAAPAPAPRAVAAPARDPIADLINGGDLRPPADVRAANRSAAAPRN